MLCEERRNLAEGFAGFGYAVVVPIHPVALSFIDMQIGFHAGAAQLAMHVPYC